MDRNEFKATITDYDAFPDMSEEEHELLADELREIEDISELKANLALIGVILEPKNSRELTSDGPGMYDTVH
jgi:hypothetical protein